MSDPITMLSLPGDDQRPSVITAEASMESLQALIGGWFECQGDDDLSIWSDEEGRTQGLGNHPLRLELIRRHGQ